MKERYTVNIAGYQLHLLSEDTEEYITSLAAAVSRDVEEIITNARNTNAVEAALLVALNTMDSRVKAVEEFRSQQAQIAEQLKEISHLKAEVAQLKAELAVTEISDGEQLSFPMEAMGVATPAEEPTEAASMQETFDF